MSDKYKINEQNAPYFITMTTVGWIDVFTRKELKLIIVDSLKYCQQNKGLVVYAWCLMPSLRASKCIRKIQAAQRNSAGICISFKAYSEIRLIPALLPVIEPSNLKNQVKLKVA